MKSNFKIILRLIMSLAEFVLSDVVYESLSPNEVNFHKRGEISQEKLIKIMELYDDVSPDTWTYNNVIPDYKCSIPYETSTGHWFCQEDYGDTYYCSHKKWYSYHPGVKNQPTSTCIKKAPNNLIADSNIWKVPAKCSPIFEHNHPSKGWFYYKGCALINGNKRPPQCSSHISSKEGQLMDCIDRRKRDGEWSEWGEYSKCKKSCGEEFQSRSRSCTAPTNGGNDCVGLDRESISCNNKLCPIDGNWSQWSQWSLCKKSCGKEFQSRSRSCTNPYAQYNGKTCVGLENEEKNCRHKLCPIDGKWSQWSLWSECKKSCGEESKKRSRSCSAPRPQYYGKNCKGDDSQSESCKNKKCLVDGKWTQWSQWSKCRKSCGEELQSRSRSCTDPSPIYPGKNCEGDDNELKSCNNEICPGAFKKMSNKGGVSNYIFAILASMGAVFVIAFVIATVIYRKRRRRYSDSSSEQSYFYQESDSD